MRPTAFTLRLGLVGFWGMWLGIGCVPIEQDSGNPLPDQVLSETPVPPSSITKAFQETESNDTFETANLVSWRNTVKLSGAIAVGQGTLDRDIFDLGPVSAGYRVRGTLSIQAGADVVLGLLDQDQNLLSFINPAASTSGPREIDLVLREAVHQLYVQVATREAGDRNQPYEVAISVEGAGVLGYRPQIIVLNFQGAQNVRIGHRPAVNVPAFDAATIDTRFAGQTETVIQTLLEMVEEDYAGLNVSFYLAGESYIPAGERTTIYFGYSDDSLLGLADNIDPYNTDTEQAAIVFTDVFSIFSVLNPDVEDIAQALANVTSHELGHLLGLRHTADVRDIMDITASANRMLRDQWFCDAILHEQVLPLGTQNSPKLLAWAVGGELVPPSQMKQLARQMKARVIPQGVADFHIDRSHLACNSHE